MTEVVVMNVDLVGLCVAKFRVISDCNQFKKKEEEE